MGLKNRSRFAGTNGGGGNRSRSTGTIEGLNNTDLRGSGGVENKYRSTGYCNGGWRIDLRRLVGQNVQSMFVGTLREN